MGNQRYEPLPRSNKGSERLQDTFFSRKKPRSKTRSDRYLEQNNNKSRVEEGVNTDNSEDEE